MQEQNREGRYIVIVGNPEHPEVRGIKGWAGEEACVIQDRADAEKFSVDANKKICIVSQTTFNYNKFKDLVEIISEKSMM